MSSKYLVLIVTFALRCTFVFGEEKVTPEKVTYDDHVKPIFREHCLSCHHAGDKNSGLALDTYAATLEGGSGGKSIVEAEPDASRLLALISHRSQPHMPPDQDPISESAQKTIFRWIEQGMPENSGSEIKKAKANSTALISGGLGRPQGAPAMPETTFKQPPLYTSRPSAIAAMAASPWSPLLAIGGQQMVSLYHMETGELLGILPFPEGEPQSIRFSRDGTLVLVGGGNHSRNGCAVLFQLNTGERVAKVGDELDIVLAADLSEDNSKIALAGPQKMVRVFETVTGKLLFEQKKHTDWIYAIRFSPDGVLLASADRSNGLVVWEADTGRLYFDLVGHKGEIRSIAWRPDSSTLISASHDGTIKWWDMFEGKLLKSIDAHPGGVSAIDVCNDGTMVSTGKDRKVKVWDANGTTAGEMPGLAEVGLEVAIEVDAKQIAAGDWLGNVQVWNRADPKKSFSLAANPPTLEMVLAERQSKWEKLDGKLLAMQADASSRQKTADDWQQRISRNETEVARMTNDLNSLAPQMTSLQKALQDDAKTIADLESKLAELRKSQEKKRQELTALEKNAQLLSSQADPLRAELVELKSNAPKLLEQAAQAKASVAAVESERSEAIALLEATRRDLQYFGEYLSRSVRRADELRAEFARNQQQFLDTQQRVMAERSRQEQLVNQVTELQLQIEQLEKLRSEELKSQGESSNKIVDQEKVIGTLKVTLEKIENELLQIDEHQATFLRAYPNYRK